VWVVVSFFELDTGRLLGRGRRCLEGLISNAASKNQRAYKFPLNSVDVLGANGLSWGCFDMSASAMPQDLANQYPVKFGRDAGPVPTDNMATREEFAAQLLRCFPPPAPSPHLPAKKRPQRGRRSWKLACAALVAAVAAAAARHKAVHAGKPTFVCVAPLSPLHRIQSLASSHHRAGC
ncbi:unnamed protein product, partial [Polarella glacialis]